ncbi:MAG TPA: hypothetical protein PKB10_03700 [Tepidisphaeraceae bacterium]|nr:hypothetical protein [Tepidisphaeraceae bacterium]
MSLLTSNAIRTVLLHDSVSGCEHPVHRLLEGIGHEVEPATVGQLDHALESDRAELVVVDLEGSADEADVARRIASLPADRRPKHVAFLTDTPDLARALPASGPHFHVFVRPLHMYGLVNVIKRIHQQHVA